MSSTPNMPKVGDKYDVGPYSFTVASVHERDPGTTCRYLSEAPLRMGRFTGYLTLNYEPWPDEDGEQPFCCQIHVDLQPLFPDAGDVIQGDGDLDLHGPDRATPEEAVEAALRVLRTLHSAFPAPSACAACQGRGTVQNDPDADEEYEMVECSDCGGTCVQHEIGPREADA